MTEMESALNRPHRVHVRESPRRPLTFTRMENIADDVVRIAAGLDRERLHLVVQLARRRRHRLVLVQQRLGETRSRTFVTDTLRSSRCQTRRD